MKTRLFLRKSSSLKLLLPANDRKQTLEKWVQNSRSVKLNTKALLGDEIVHLKILT
ncbi:MAG: hypothetical protein PSV36_01620 [Algoriphagus sp.]|nr:hypothetical protein [Algoriphagus sp.]